MDKIIGYVVKAEIEDIFLAGVLRPCTGESDAAAAAAAYDLTTDLERAMLFPTKKEAEQAAQNLNYYVCCCGEGFAAEECYVSMVAKIR